MKQTAIEVFIRKMLIYGAQLDQSASIIESSMIINDAEILYRNHTSELQAKHEEELKQAVINTVMDSGLGSDHFRKISGRYESEQFVEAMKAKALEYYKANHEPK